MEQNNYYTIPAVAKLIAKHKYKLVECLDQQGSKVIPGHQANVKPEKWILSNLKPWAEKPQTRPGAYYIYCYMDSRRKTQPDQYAIHVGEVPPNAAPPTPPVNVKVVVPATKSYLQEENNPLSFESYQQLMREITDLKTEVISLRNDNARLKSENEEYKNDQKEHLSEKENSNFMASLMPLAEVFLQERKTNQMMQLAIAAQTNPQLAAMLPYMFSPQQNGLAQGTGGMPSPQQQPQQNNSLDKANDFIRNHTSEDEYKIIENIRSRNNSLDSFYECFYKEQPELYAKFYYFVNGGKNE
jgi:hypothetical protein